MTSPTPAAKALDLLARVLGYVAVGLVVATVINVAALMLADIATSRSHSDKELNIEGRIEK